MSKRYYVRAGSCPRCGAPIYAHFVPLYSKQPEGIIAAVDEPTAHFTCACRLTMPAADGDAPLEESTEVADRKHMARTRPGGQEPASTERAE